jgi:hypothetical protein
VAYGGRFGDVLIYVTAEQLVALTEQVQALLEPYQDKAARADGSRPVNVVRMAIPTSEDGVP